jgi:hypothetical protein
MSRLFLSKILRKRKRRGSMLREVVVPSITQQINALEQWREEELGVQREEHVPLPVHLAEQSLAELVQVRGARRHPQFAIISRPCLTGLRLCVPRIDRGGGRGGGITGRCTLASSWTPSAGPVCWEWGE